MATIISKGELDTKTVKELKDICRIQGIKLSGNKAEIIGRISAERKDTEEAIELANDPQTTDDSNIDKETTGDVSENNNDELKGPFPIELIKTLKVAELKDFCRGYRLKAPAKKSELVNTLLQYHAQVIEGQKYIERCKKTLLEPEMMQYIDKVCSWFKQNNLYLAKDDCIIGERLPVYEARYCFSQYEPEEVEDSCSATNGGVKKSDKHLFLEMFFEKLGTEWMYYPVSDDDEYHENFEYYESEFLAFLGK